ncbi:MAG: T9SS type A sorting domain-containing protein [Gemmatimonadota bacterium]|nr:MAG: T9SS type A sorting domain-containing protein [Gemmatimonadota bacterium]
MNKNVRRLILTSLCFILISMTSAVADGHIQDGTEHTAVAVGDTATFWSYSRSFFSTGYFRTEAICRAVGEKCYIFVETNRWTFGDVDSVDVQNILTAFEHRTTAVDSSASGLLASTEGIYDKVTSAFGQPPDFDGDPRIYILVMDVRAEGFSGWNRYGENFLGPLAEHGYFDPVNEYSARVDSFSNEHELLYMDCLPNNPSSPTALASLAHSLQRLIHWYNDPIEERWITEGCSMLAQFLCGYGVTTGYFDPMEPFVGFTVFTDQYGDWVWEPDVIQNSMLMHYYFERYGFDFISALVADDAYQGIEAIDTTLAALDYEDSFSEVFEDFVLTWYFLSLGLAADSSFYGGKYSLRYLSPEDVSGTIINSFLYWGLPGFLEPPYEYTWTSSWSAAFIAMTAHFSGDIDSMLVFNGEDGSEYSLVVIKAQNDWLQPLDQGAQVEFIPLDDENRGYCDVSGYKTEYRTIYMAIVTRSLAGNGALYISDDITPPDSLNFVVFHGPIDDRSLDLYVFSKEELISGQRPYPLLEFTQHDTTDTLAMYRFYPYYEDRHSNDPHIYQGNYWLSNDGVIDVRVNGQDVSGNHAPEYETSFTVSFIPAKIGGEIASHDGKVNVRIPAHSLSKDTWISVFQQNAEDPIYLPKEIPPRLSIPKTMGRRTIGDVYRIGPTGATLQQPGILTLQYDRDDAADELTQPAVYRQNAEGWEYVGGDVDSRHGTITVTIDKLGTYQIQTGSHDEPEGSIPSSYQLSQNFPNPFNSNTDIRYQIADKGSHVHTTLIIYNILGQEVRTLVDEDKEPGYYTVHWDGRDHNGSEVASGVYFYRISLADGTWQESKRMVFLK